MSELATTAIERGRRFVRLIVFIIFGGEALTLSLAIIAIAEAFGVLELPIDSNTIIRLAIEAGLLYCIYRGFTWARWITGALLALGALTGIASLLQLSSYGLIYSGQGISQPLALAVLVIVIVADAIGAVLLLGSSSVRDFQQAQRAG